MTLRVLLTGATGFVGQQVLKSLKQQNAYVRIITRNQTNVGAADDTVITKDIFLETQTWWELQLENIDIVIHAAWFVEPGKYLNAVENVNCLQGSLRLAKAFIKSNAKHFVGIGTCFEYDLNGEILTTKTRLNPTTLYAATKTSLFLTLSQLLPPLGKTYSWCRLFYLYGENEDPRRIVPYLHQQLSAGHKAILSSGEQIRDFLNITEAGDRITKTALQQLSGPVNICSGTPITIQALAEQIADEYGRRDLLNFGMRPDNLQDPPSVVGEPTPL